MPPRDPHTPAGRAAPADGGASAPAPSGRWAAWWPVAAVAVLAAVVLAVFLAVAFGGDDEQPAAGDVRADVERLGGLADGARRQVEPVLGQVVATEPNAALLAAAAPEGRALVRQIEVWERRVRGESARFAARPFGGVPTQIAYAGFGVALDQIAQSLRTYRAALALPVERRYEGLADAREQRELGVRSWSVAAVQLDELSEGAGLGHRHLFFSTLQVRRALGPGLAPVREGVTVDPHDHEHAPGEE